MSQPSISITSPGPNATVGAGFTAAGMVSPANSSVSVTWKGIGASSVTVAGTGSWHANFAGLPPGVGTLNACITGIEGPCVSETITVQ
jgi:hypothetical protein